MGQDQRKKQFLSSLSKKKLRKLNIPFALNNKNQKELSPSYLSTPNKEDFLTHKIVNQENKRFK